MDHSLAKDRSVAMQDSGTPALRSFLRRELDSLVPLMTPAEAASLRHDLANEDLLVQNATPKSFERALAVASTKTWHINLHRSGKHILCSAYDIGQWTSLAPLISQALTDRRIGALTFLGGGPAALQFEERFGDVAENFSAAGSSALAAFHSLALFSSGQTGIKPIDIAVATVSARFGPDTWLLTNAKSVLGASKLVLIYDVYGVVPESVPDIIDQIDLVLCSDAITRECFLQTNRWDIEHGKVFITRTGQTVAPVAHEQIQTLRDTALQKLDLSGEEVVISLLGDMTVEKDWGLGLSSNLAEEKMHDALKVIERIAKTNRSKQFAAILRPHPADPGSDRLQALVALFKQTENFKIRWCDTKLVSIDQLAACSQAICSLFSTESFKAPDRGIVGIFLDSRYFSQCAPEALMRAVHSQPNFKVAADAKELETILSGLEISKLGICDNDRSGDATSAMIAILLD